MIIGVPKEIKNNENRVALTPAGASELIKHGHTLYVQKTAGEGSGFADAEYQAAGATILNTIEEVYEPYLIMEGYLQRTPQGRVATELSFKKLGLKPAGGKQANLF